MNQKCVIFGAGYRGLLAYNKLSVHFDVIAYSDNNSKLWGTQKNSVKIIPPNQLPVVVKKTQAVIFIANELYHDDIADQLDALHLSYLYYEDGLCYERENRIWYPVHSTGLVPYKKEDEKKLAVLFVQDIPCTRTNKIANVLKAKGVLTYSAYSCAPSGTGANSYYQEFPFWSYQELLDFVNQSEFDIIHCSNEPDVLVNILRHSNKKVIHDCHDVMTIQRKGISQDGIALEYLANTQADGVMCTTERVCKILTRKYRLAGEKTFVLENYPLCSLENVERKTKLSAVDGQLHCVYEGGIVNRLEAEKTPYRFYEPIFARLALAGVHVHIYSHRNPEYLKQLEREYSNIHFEGNYSGPELVSWMTQYDLALLIYPNPECISYMMEFLSPNKLYEYLAAGLPVITNIQQFGDFARQNHCGGMVDIDSGDVVSQLRQYSGIEIPEKFCTTHGLTMDAHAEQILAFYRKILSS